MSPRQRQGPGEEPDLAFVDFLSEGEEGSPATPIRPWAPAGAEIGGHSGGGAAPTLLSIAKDDFASEEPVPHRSAASAEIVLVRVPAARPAPPPPLRPEPRVTPFSVYAMLAIGGAAVGWLAGGFASTRGPQATDAALETSASPEWVPFAALGDPVRRDAIRLAHAASDDRIEPRVDKLATPPANAANTTSASHAARPVAPIPVPPPPAPATPSADAPRPGAVAASTPAVPNPEPPPTEPLRAEPARPEPPRPEPLRSEPLRSEPLRPEPPRPEPSSSEPPRSELPDAEAARRRETRLIETVLDRWVGAFNTLDAEATRAVWPGVDARALDRVFTQLEEQELTFEECRVELDEGRATAVCRGVARYVPRVGSRSWRSTPRQWTFRLQKVGDRWTIDGVNTR